MNLDQITNKNNNDPKAKQQDIPTGRKEASQDQLLNQELKRYESLSKRKRKRRPSYLKNKTTNKSGRMKTSTLMTGLKAKII
jgi:hypothetical protein